MNTMNVSLPIKMKDYVEEQVKAGAYGTASEYVRQLIREDQEKKQRARVDALLLEALESGKPIDITPEYWEGKRKHLTELSKREKVTKKRS